MLTTPRQHAIMLVLIGAIPPHGVKIMAMFTVTIKKTGDELVFDTTTLPPTSIDYLVEYGLKQSLNDVHAAILPKDYATKTPAEFTADVRAKVAAREEQIRSGNVPSTRAPADPKTAAARKMAADLVKDDVTADELAAAMEIIRKKRTKATAQHASA